MTTAATSPPRAGERPPLPAPRGPLSEAVLAALARLGPADPAPMLDAAASSREDADPFGDDLHLALYVCYELHYRGFGGVDDGWEWAPGLLAFRGELERRFLTALRAETGPGDDVDGVLTEVLAEPADAYGVSHYLREEGEWWHMREHAVHRSAYHLKEADPHAWLIPRLRGQAKAALVAVEFDEFGGGRGEAMHARLFADLMEDLGLDPSYGRYLDLVPGRMLAIVNMMSLFGLHRALRGAMAGHFAAAEITTAPAARRMAAALERLGASPRCVRFHTEHIEADAVHEQVLRHDVLGDLLAREPALACDVVFGVRATGFLEDRFGEHLLASWREGRTSLRQALPTGTG
ncbi:iron-containing redox enzyme family protein [Actinomadura montaniterrae]|uniref:Iron-containing redox enzyme family protein n=1 Tax=Actinomadura montaniterrae TaxID=1803903 RepID=A0A6L3W857_9ACTN|nr:iron-containing redox enzyme family protein [Actinomadura montaniterrae]KAB2388018.1 iron-containing redox enzyme family protein [Actinomadura montaniterrae]